MAKSKAPALKGHYFKEGKYFCWRLSVGTRENPQVITVKRSTTKSRDEGIAAKLKELKDNGTILAKGAEPTFKQHWNKWMETKVKPNRSRNTIESYEQMGRDHILPVIGKIKMSKLNETDVQAVVAAATAKGLGRTASYAATIIFSCLGKRRTLEIREDVELPAPSQPRDRVLHEEEIPLILDELYRETPYKDPKRAGQTYPAHRDRHLLMFALNVGLRINEILGVETFRVSLKDATYAMQYQLSRFKDAKGQPAWELAELKNKKPRTVYLNDVALQAVKDQMALIRAEKELAGSGYEDHGLLFCTEAGTPHSDRNVRRCLDSVIAAINKRVEAENATKRLGEERLEPIAPVTLHDLRRTYLTYLADAGNTLQDVSAAAGHANIETTRRNYIRTRDKRRQAVAASISFGRQPVEQAKERQA